MYPHAHFHIDVTGTDTTPLPAGTSLTSPFTLRWTDGGATIWKYVREFRGLKP